MVLSDLTGLRLTRTPPWPLPFCARCHNSKHADAIDFQFISPFEIIQTGSILIQAGP